MLAPFPNRPKRPQNFLYTHHIRILCIHVEQVRAMRRIGAIANGGFRHDAPKAELNRIACSGANAPAGGCAAHDQRVYAEVLE